MNVLVFSPHPDDDVIGCGGSIISHVKQGDKVTVVYVTSGDAGDMRYSPEDMSAIREREVAEAAKIMGVDQTIFLKLQDGYVMYSKETLIQFTKIIRELKPHIVYTPHANDNHVDHKATHVLTVEAVKRANMNSYKESGESLWNVDTLLCYEVWSPLPHVQFTRDITEIIDTKVAALEKHASQLANLDYIGAVKSLNMYRGITTGKGRYVECFEILKVGKV